MKLENYTPHQVNYYAPCGAIIELPSVGVARVDSEAQNIGSFGLNDSTILIKLQSQKLGEITGLPKKRDNVYIIVSAMVKSASDRSDLLSPADYIRDNGRVIGCMAFNK